MSGKAYRIKALEWTTEGAHTTAKTPFGEVSVFHGLDGWLVRKDPRKLSEPCDSFSDGKAKCEALYRERMERGLEEVKDGE